MDGTARFGYAAQQVIKILTQLWCRTTLGKMSHRLERIKMSSFILLYIYIKHCICNLTYEEIHINTGKMLGNICTKTYCYEPRRDHRAKFNTCNPTQTILKALRRRTCQRHVSLLYFLNVLPRKRVPRSHLPCEQSHTRKK